MIREIWRATLAVAVSSMVLGALVAGCAGGEGDCGDIADFELCCEGERVVPSINVNHCGACGNACAAGATCNAGVCSAGGMDGGGNDAGPGGGMCGSSCNDTGDGATQRCCGGNCISRSVPQGSDGTSDPSFMNCNGCGIPCDPMRANSCSVVGGGTGMPRCLCGDFPACRADEVCVNEAGTYSCISTSTDPDNCGMLGNECAEGETCLGGMCVCGGTGGSCGAGEACCAGACTPILTDAMNCGGCGVQCGQNGPNCNNGTCGCGTGGACRPATPPMGGFPGFPIPIPGIGMGGDPGELCCADTCVANDSANCGACGTMCGAMEECRVATPLLGGTAEICCLEPDDPGILGCGGGGFPFPFPDGGLPIDAGI